ncbi:hypothetical protein, partial [Bacillus sp. WP8]|uniref:hypothetical protein n=1 Tax=Bacillus sp. WP8 TaxID=756828 RepID=UPI001C92CF2F
ALPRIQQLFEARNPKPQATISQIHPLLPQINHLPHNHHQILLQPQLQTPSYTPPYNPPLKLLQRDKLTPPQLLTQASIHPKQLLKLTHITPLQQ